MVDNNDGMYDIDRESWAYWYDLINTKERDDYQFYTRHLNKDNLALEIACGTGRIYLDMLQDGYQVHGLDVSENMLKKLRKKAEDRNVNINELFLQDVSTMSLDYNYDFIYYPFNSIAQINGSVDEQVVTFENIHSHLKEDGSFAFDIYVMDFDSIADYGELKSKTFEHNGSRYKLEKWSEITSKTEQRLKSYNRIINLDKMVIEWETDYVLSLYPKQQIESILSRAGFSDYTFYDGFSTDLIHDESNHMSVVAQK